MKKNRITILIAALCCFCIANAQQYTSTLKEQNGNFPIPANVTKIKVEAWGGGGAGGYTSGNFLNYKASGAGGGGAYAGAIFSIDLGSNKAITVSNIQAGNNSSSNSSIKDGGNTTVKYGNSTIVVAEGGKSVRNTNNTTGAQGGKADNCTGTWKFSGGNGSKGTNGSIGGGGGGAAGSAADGENGENSSAISADGGASGGDLGGAGGTGRTGASSGTTGGKYGGGGSGVVSPAFGGTRTGGSGYQGVVRFTYMPFYINNGTVAVTPGAQREFAPVSNLNQLQYRVEQQGTNSNVSYTINVDNKDKIMISNVTNTSNSIQTVTIKFAGVWTDNIDLDRGFDTLTRFFLVTLDIYPEIKPGKIGEEIVTCTATDTIKKFTNVENADNYVSYRWQFSEDNTNWVLIQGATGEMFTPNGATNKTGWFRRCAVNAINDMAFSNAIHTSVGNVKPGDISLNSNATEQGEYCKDEEIHVDIKANPIIDNAAYQTSYTIQWQKRINDGEWADIAGANNDEYIETFKLGSADNGSIADSVQFRYLFKFAECAIVPSNNTYKQKILSANDYYSPVLTSDRKITLWYGACDTAVVIPTLDPQPLEISCTPTRIGHGTTTVKWTVREPCGGVLVYDQVFTVSYPECEQSVNVDGIAYNVVRVGCDCWMAENLRVEAEDATCYDNDDANMAFGRLYSWNAALKGLKGSSSQDPQNQGNNNTNNNVQPLLLAPATPPTSSSNVVKTVETMLGTAVQGICPDGWAIPTTEQFYKLTNAGDATKLKTSDVSKWLIDYAGVEPVTGFDAVGAGYYDSEVRAYYKQLGISRMWTSEIIENSVKGVCCSITYSCPDIKIDQVNKTSHNSVRCVRVEPKTGNSN